MFGLWPRKCSTTCSSESNSGRSFRPSCISYGISRFHSRVAGGNALCICGYRARPPAAPALFSRIPRFCGTSLVLHSLGVICMEIFLFLSQLLGNIRAGVVVVIAALPLLASKHFVAVSRNFYQLLSSVLNGPRLEKTLASLAGLKTYCVAKPTVSGRT